MLHDAQALAMTDLLKGIPGEILERVAGQGTIRGLGAGEALIGPDRTNEQLYIVLSGRLSVHLSAVNSPVLRVIERGGSVGEISVMLNRPPTAWVVALEPTTLFCMGHELMWWLIDNTTVMARNMLHIMGHRLTTNADTIVEQQGQIENLAAQTVRDGLTGLYNRRWLEEALPASIACARRECLPLCLIALDVDHFKRYNDTYGHQAGDQVLITLAQVLRRELRANGHAVRYGGEEFLVLLPATSREDGMAVAERLRDAVASVPVVCPNGDALPSITVSLGLAVSTGSDTGEALIASADKNLYQAKATGRNRCVG